MRGEVYPYAITTAPSSRACLTVLYFEPLAYFGPRLRTANFSARFEPGKTSEIGGSIMSETNDRTTTVNAAASLTYGQPRWLKRTRCGLTSGQRQPPEHYLVTQSR